MSSHEAAMVVVDLVVDRSPGLGLADLLEPDPGHAEGWSK